MQTDERMSGPWEQEMGHDNCLLQVRHLKNGHWFKEDKGGRGRSDSEMKLRTLDLSGHMMASILARSGRQGLESGKGSLACPGVGAHAHTPPGAHPAPRRLDSPGPACRGAPTIQGNRRRGVAIDWPTAK